ncbi:MAG: hypothetical protein EB058_13665, partial [Proteobacteria bacterium]|nr:hypothetical protein [Pseudomonadota bacterium]
MTGRRPHQCLRFQTQFRDLRTFGQSAAPGPHSRFPAPAVADARALGIDAHGPLPADSVFVAAMRGEYDAVVAMFHDQGHIPVKVHGFEESVSVALGLPIVRTSVDHGTAFGIAGTGVADAR